MYTLEQSMQLAIFYGELEEADVPGLDQLALRQGFCRLFARAMKSGVFLPGLPADRLKSLFDRRFSDAERQLLTAWIGDCARWERLEDQAQQELILCGEYDIGMLTYEEIGYPCRLREIDSPPPILFYRGTMPDEEQLDKSLCIVGTRTPEDVYAPATALWAAGELASRGWINISGLALGCDTFGHLASLQSGGLTGAVLGNGLARTPYPPQNMMLAELMVERGGFLLSESIPSAEVTGTSLILRDRLQGALGRAVFVIETDLGSGTIFTVDYTLRMDKLVFVWDPTGSGLEKESVLAGNQMLLGRDPVPAWLSLPGREKSDKIIPVLDGRELVSWLDGLAGQTDDMMC